MKKVFIKIGLVALFFAAIPTMNSCSDALDIVQPGEITGDVVFTNVSNLNDFLNGAVYANADTNLDIYISAVITDEVKPGYASGGQEFQEHRFYINPSWARNAEMWLQHYKLINNVNRLLEGAAKFTPADTEKAQYDNIIAQARALRAFAYLQLETFYSEDMKNDDALGVIIVDGVPTAGVNKARSTNKEVFDVINADLEFAKGILKRGDVQHANLDFVYAMSARLNLYRGKYAEAKAAALEVVNNSGLSLTKATPSVPENFTGEIGDDEWNTAFYNTTGSFNPYRNIWNDSNSGESIFSFARLASGVGSSIGMRWNTNRSEFSGSPMWNMGRNLFNIINGTDGDIRRYAYLDPTSKIDPNYETSSAPIETDVLVIDKYPGIENGPTRNHLKVFRLSEMYFILAECAVAENNLTEAANYIQQVREARNYKGTATTPAYTNKTVALADILLERRVELAFEGHRYIDLKRLATAAGVTMDRNETDDIVNVQNLPNDSYKYTLPIPLSEIAGNPAVASQQNKGY